MSWRHTTYRTTFLLAHINSVPSKTHSGRPNIRTLFGLSPIPSWFLTFELYHTCHAEVHYRVSSFTRQSHPEPIPSSSAANPVDIGPAPHVLPFRSHPVIVLPVISLANSLWSVPPVKMILSSWASTETILYPWQESSISFRALSTSVIA